MIRTYTVRHGQLRTNAGTNDVAVHPAYQRQGIGRRLMNELEQAVPGLRIYLTATFGNELFYERLGYRRHRTARAKYPPPFETSTYLEPPDLSQ